MKDWRTKLAALVVVLGLGGLGGYAISSRRNVDPPVASVPGTEVIRRTVHAKPRHAGRAQTGGDRPAVGAASTLASEPVSTGTSSSSSSSYSPVRTGSSGAGGSAGGAEREDTGEGGERGDD